MKLRVILTGILLVIFFNVGIAPSLFASQPLPEAETFEQDWRSVATVLKRGGYSAPQVKILLAMLQKAGIQTQNIHGEGQILELAKTLSEKLKNGEIGIVDEGLVDDVSSDGVKEAVSTKKKGGASYKWKVVAVVCACIAVVAIILWYYERQETHRLLRDAAIREGLIRDDLNRQLQELRQGRPPQRVFAGDVCAVCQDEGGVRSVLSCGHTFHNNCALPWVRAHHNCPECRQQASITNQVIVFPDHQH